MNHACVTFRNQFEKGWNEQPNVKLLLGKYPHWEICADCNKYIQSYRKLDRVFDAEQIPEPDWVKVRMNVWAEIDQRTERQSWMQHWIKPVVLAPVATAVAAFMMFIAFQYSGANRPGISPDFIFAQVDSTVTADYPTDQEIQEYFDNEFSGGVDSYLIENASYSTIDEYFSSADDNWGQVLQSLAEQQI